MSEIIQSYDGANPTLDRDARLADERRARNDADTLRHIMRNPEGRDWLYRFLEKCHIFSDPFAPGQPDVTAYALGEQNVGKQLWLEAQDASLDLYMRMIKEQKDEEQRLTKVRRAMEREAEVAAGMQPLMPDLPPPEGWTGG